MSDSVFHGFIRPAPVDWLGDGRRLKVAAMMGQARRYVLAGIMLPFAASLAGCTPKASPSVPLLGAFFPSWLLCAVIGILGALLIRVIFVRAGVDDQLPWRSIVYVSIAASIGFGFSLLVYGR